MPISTVRQATNTSGDRVRGLNRSIVRTIVASSGGALPEKANQQPQGLPPASSPDLSLIEANRPGAANRK
jgi:hypothetical protein